MSDRWGTLTDEEKQMIHHALRMLLTHPMRLPEDDEATATRLADEIWDEHCEMVGARA